MKNVQKPNQDLFWTQLRAGSPKQAYPETIKNDSYSM